MWKFRTSHHLPYLLLIMLILVGAVAVTKYPLTDQDTGTRIVLRYAATPAMPAYTHVTIQNAIGAIGVTPVRLLITPETWQVGAGLTFPSTMTAWLTSGTLLNANAGTMTFNGPVIIDPGALIQSNGGAVVFNGPVQCLPAQHCFTKTSGTITFAASTRREITMENFGARADGVTDNTTTGQAAMNAGVSTLHLMQGTYLGNWIHGSTTLSILGAGQLSELKTPNTDPVLTITTAPEANSPGREFKNFKINGNSRAGHGVQYNLIATGDRWEGVFFRQVDRGINAPNSAIGFRIHQCAFQGANYGIYLKGTSGFAINENHIIENRFLNIDMAAVYVDANLAAGGFAGGSALYIRDNWFESVPGFGVYVKGFVRSGRGVSEIRGGWWEGVGTDTTTTLDDEGVVTTQALSLSGGAWRIGVGVTPQEKMALDDVELTFEHMKLVAGATIPVLSGDSMVTVTEAFTDTGGGQYVGSPLTGGRILVDRARFLRDERGILIETYERTADMTGPVNLAAVAPRTSPRLTNVAGGASQALQPYLYQGYGVRSVTLPTDAAIAGVGTFPVTDGHTYVISLAVRSNTGSSHRFRLDTTGGTGALFSTRTISARAQSWTTYLYIGNAIHTGTSNFRILGHSDGAAGVDVAKLQVIDCPDRSSCYKYADARHFARLTNTLQAEYVIDMAAPGAAPGCVSSTQTLAGSVVGSPCEASMDVAVHAEQTLRCEVNTAAQVTFKICQFGGVAANPDGAGTTYRAVVQNQ